jgi:GT2 family glycosyltransferase
MKLSIIIINYNTFDLTCACIRSIRETAHVDYEIILIDNNSRERAAADFLSAFPDVRLIALQENVGFGRANNIGMEAARGEFFLLLNSDTVVLENTLDSTVAYLSEHASIDMLGCRTLNPDGTDQLTVFSYGGELNLASAVQFFFKKNSIVREWIRAWNFGWRKMRAIFKSKNAEVKTAFNPGSEIVPNYNNGERIGSLMGVFLLFRRNVYESTRGFDPDFFMYYEESEWFLKRLRNHSIIYYPHASIIHYYGKSDVYGRMNLQSYISSYLFWYKISYWHYLFYVLFNLIDIPSKVLVGLLKFSNRTLKDVALNVKALPYALFEIPRYPNGFGARKDMLKLAYIRKNKL